MSDQDSNDSPNGVDHTMERIKQLQEMLARFKDCKSELEKHGFMVNENITVTDESWKSYLT